MAIEIADLTKTDSQSMSATRHPRAAKSSKSSTADTSRDQDMMLEAMLRLEASASYRVLEQRMVFDGAAADTTVKVAETPNADAQPSPPSEPSTGEVVAALAAQPVAEPAPPAPEAAAAHEIVFVDTNVRNYDQFLRSIPAGAEVVVIDGSQDGMHQIAAALAGRHDISAIHIISHGTEAALDIGTANLDANSMRTRYADDLAVVKSALTTTADILIYGCDFARGADGAAAAATLANLTGADVAASTDDTGSNNLGANWTLEYHSGTITTAVVVDAATQASYNDVLSAAAHNDSYVVYTAGTQRLASVLANDQYSGDTTGVPSDQLTISSYDATTTHGGTVSFFADGSFNYTPATGFGGTDTFTYTVRSPANEFSTATVTLQVYSKPTASADTATTTASTPVTIDVRSNDSDPDTSSLAITHVNGTAIVDGGPAVAVTNGSVKLISGNLQFTPTAGYVGAASFTYTLTDTNPTAVSPYDSLQSSGAMTFNTFANKTSGAVAGNTFTVNTSTSTNLTTYNSGLPSPHNANVATFDIAASWSGSRTITFATPIDSSYRIFIQDVDQSESISLQFKDAAGNTIDPSSFRTELWMGGVAATSGSNLTVSSTTMSIVSNGSAASDPTFAITPNAAVKSIVISSPGTAGGSWDLFFGKVNNTTTALTSTATVNVSVTGMNPVLDLDRSTSSATDALAGTGHFPAGSNSATNSIAGWTLDTGSVWSWAGHIQFYDEPITQTLTSTTTVSGLDIGPSANGTAQVEVVLSTSNASPVTSPAHAVTMDVVVAGTLYARVSTSEGQGTASTITYFNGASGTFNGSTTQTPVVTQSGTYTFGTWLIDLPSNVAASGKIQFVYRAPSGGSDDISLDSVRVLTQTDTSSGTSYATVYKENAAAVSVVGASTGLFDSDSGNMASATVVLTNAQTGDRLLVNGATTTTGTLAGGAISYVISGSTITLTGSATKAQYVAALQAITFDNTTDNPSTTPRVVTVVVNDGALSSNTAQTTISIDLAPDPVNDSFSTSEDTSVSGNVRTNDTDLGTTPITSVTVVTAPGHGTLSSFDTTTGAFVYVPTANYNGSDTFTYRVTDANGDTKNATVTITIAAVNDAPAQTLPGAQTTNEDTALSITGVSVADVDGAGVTLTTTLSVPSAAGRLNVVASGGATISGDGTANVTLSGTAAAINAALATITFTPVADWNGTANLTVSTSDGIAATVSGTIALTVTAVADAVTDTATMAEDTSLELNVLTNDNFENPAASITSVTQPAHGSVTIGTGGNVIYTPYANYNGTDSFTYTVTSGGVTETATANITITAVDDAPVNTVPGARTTAEDTSTSITGVSVSDSDGAGVPLTTTVSLPAGTGTLSVLTGGGATISGNGTGTVTISGTATQINAAIATITYSPAADWNGTSAMTVATNDGTATTTSTVGLTVTSVADITNDSISASEDVAKTFNVISGTNGATADTFEGTPSLTSVTSPANGTVSFAADGTITYTPTANFNGSDSFTYTVTSGGVTETATVTITVAAVNDAPTNVVPGAQTTNEDASLVFSAAAGNGIAVGDVDSNVTTTLTVTNGTLTLGSLSGVSVTGNGTGTVTVSGAPASVNAALNGLSFAPTADWNGTTTLGVSTSDGVAPATVNSIAITVAAVSDIAPDSQTTAEDTAKTFNVLGNDSFENSAAAVSAVTQPAHGTVTIGANGNVTYTPSTNYNGSDSFTYTVTSGGVTETTTVNMTVTAVNDAPRANSIFARTSSDNATTSYAVAGYFSDVDGDVLTYSATGLPAGLSINSATGTISGTIDRHASTGGTGGVYAVTVTATDPSGATASRTFNWTVTNPAPTAVSESFTGNQNTNITGNVLTNDSDSDGDALTVNSTPVSGPTHGTLTLNTDGTFTYTPSANFSGTDTFTYQVVDADGGTATAIATIYVSSVNTPPTDGSETNSTAEDATLTVNVGDSANLLTNASDPNGKSLAITGYTIDGIAGTKSVGTPVSIPNVGTIQINADGSYSFTPAADYNGTVPQITYTVSQVGTTYSTPNSVTSTDPTLQGLSNTIDGLKGVGVPIARDDFIDATQVTNVTYSFNALQNDASGFVIWNNGGTSLSDGQSIATIASLTLLNSSGGVIATFNNVSVPEGAAGNPYTIDFGQFYSGIAQIRLSGIDGPLGDASQGVSWNEVALAFAPKTTTSTLSLTVTPVADITADSVSTNEDASISFNVRTGTNGATADTFEGSPTLTDHTLPSHGTVTVAADGSIVYTPDADYHGTDTFTYTMTSGGVTETTTVTITVAAVNDAPTQSLPSLQSGSEDTDVVFSGALGNQIVIGDVDGGTVTTTISASDGTLLAITTQGVTITGNGTRTVSLAGTPAAITAALNGLAYRPTADANGAITLTVSTSDGVAPSVSGSIAISLAPVVDISADSATTNEDTSVVISALGNDTFENPARTISATTNGAHGSVVINGNGTLTYTPDANWNGTDTFTYTVTSGGVSETATISVVVAPVNDAPTQSVPAGQTTTEDTPLTFGGTTGNTITVGDIDGGNVTTIVAATNGTVTVGSATGVTISGDGTGTVTLVGTPSAINAALDGLVFNPLADYNGGATINVTTSDGSLTATNSIAVTIVAVADAVNDTISTNEDTPISFSPFANDSFEDVGATISAITQGEHGTVTIGPGGTLVYTPAVNYNGPDSFTYTVTAGGRTETATVTVTVAPVNDAATTMVPGSQYTLEDTAIVFSSGVGNAITVADVDNDQLTVNLSASNGVLTLGSTAGVGVIGNGGASVTVTGSAAAINAALNGLSFAPTADYNGAAAITVNTFDGHVTTSRTVDISISSVIDIHTDSIITLEDQPVTVNVLPNDSFENAGAVIVGVSQSTSGTVSFLSDGTVTYTPSANFNGTDSFSYTVASGGVTETTTVSVVVSAVNDAPVATSLSDRASLDGQTTSFDVSAAFSDVDTGTILTYSATGLPQGVSINSSTGVISGTIDKSASGSAPYTVVVSVNDGSGGTASASFNWSISNPAPHATDDSATTTEDTSKVISVLANDSDPDNDALTVTSAAAANGTVAIQANGSIVYTPNADFNGTDTITYSIDDGNGGRSTATVTVVVTAVNDAPVATALGDLIDVDNENVALDVSTAFSDVDGDTLTYSVNRVPPGLTFNSATGRFTGTLAPNASAAGSYPITVTASDGHGGTAEARFTWTVINIPPTATDDSVTTDEDTAVVATVLANDTDPDRDPLHVTAINGQTIVSGGAAVAVAHGSIALATDSIGNDVLVFTPDLNWNGTTSLVYTTSDGNGGSDSGTLTIVVVPRNDAPTADALANIFSSDSDAVNVNAGAFFHDVDDVNGDTLTYSAVGLPSGVNIDLATGVISGTLDKSASTSGPYTVVVRGTDQSGAWVMKSFVWTISNPAPTASDDSYSAGENATVNGPAGSVLANDNDPDSDPLVVASVNADATLVGQPVTGSRGGLVTLRADGSYSFDPNGDFDDLAAGQTRSTSVQYLVSDGNGGVSTATLTFTVTGDNDPPVASSPALTTAEDTSVSGSVTASDIDSDPLTYTLSTPPTHGSLTLNANGTFSYTPAANYNGADSFAVTVSDGRGGTTTVTVPVTVTAVNDPPTAGNDTFTVAEDGGATSFNVLANDTFAPDAGETLSIAAVTQPSHGTVTFTGTGVSYTPDADYAGSDSFTYTISDGHGGTATATVTVSVSPVNDGPRAGNDVASVTEDTATTGNVLANDSDIEHDTLSVTHFTVGGSTYAAGMTTHLAAGDLVINTNGTFTFTPAANYNGAVPTAIYTISDGNGGTASANLVLGPVAAVNDAPVAANDTYAVTEDTAVTGSVLANDSDIDHDALRVTQFVIGGTTYAAGTTAHLAAGDLVVNADGSFTFTPAANYNGAVPTATYTMTDGQGASASATLTLGPVTAVNDPPVATNDTVAVSEDTPVSGNVLSNDSDVEHNTLSVTQFVIGGTTYAAGTTAHVAAGDLVINANGSFTFTPTANYNGVVPAAAYTVSDGNGGSATAHLVLGPITAGNDPPTAVNDTYAVTEDTPASGNVLRNDTDLENNTLRITQFVINGTTYAAGTTAHLAAGDLVIDANGNFTFTPAANYNGAVPAVTYTVSDGNGGTATARLNLGPVSAVNDAPVAVDDAATMSTQTSFVFDVLSNDHDADGDLLSVASATSDAGSVAIGPDGMLTFTPTPGFSGNAIITYVVSDGHGGSYTARAIVTVQPTDASNFTGSTQPDTTAPITRPVALAPISTTDIVLDTVRQSGGPGGISGQIAERGIVLSTVNAFTRLGDGPMPTLDTQLITTLPLLPHQITHLERLIDTYDHGRFSSTWDPSGLTGFSLRFETLTAGNNRNHSEVIIESMVRYRTLMVQISANVADPERKVSEYRILQADGSPLPDWLNRAGTVLIGERPADIDQITLKVVVLYTDGTSEAKAVSIETSSGVIKPIAEKRSEPVLPFTHQFAATGSVPPEAFDDLAALLGGGRLATSPAPAPQ